MSASSASGALPSKRIEFIDLLRGWAVIVMIETHVFNATLTLEVISSDLFEYIAFINGLVAPSFLFASGMAYAVTTRRKLEDYLAFGKPLFKQLGRLLFVLALGYLLHLPKFNYQQIMQVTEERPWRIFFQADVLQCIAMSLIFVQILLLIVKNEQVLYRLLLWLTGAIVLLTPVMWGIDFWPILPAAVAGYMNGIHFQNFPGFPVFPWSAFLFAGAVTGYYYMEARARESGEYMFMKRVLVWSPALIAVSFLLHPIAQGVYSTYDYWKFSPSFVLLRLALVLLLCAGMFYYEKKKGVSPRSAVTLMGRESLIVYATHLLLIYGNFSTFNFSKKVNHPFGYSEALLTTVFLIVLMYALALFWDRIRKGPAQRKLSLQYAALAVLVGVFFFGPGE